MNIRTSTDGIGGGGGDSDDGTNIGSSVAPPSFSIVYNDNDDMSEGDDYHHHNHNKKKKRKKKRSHIKYGRKNEFHSREHLIDDFNESNQYDSEDDDDSGDDGEYNNNNEDHIIHMVNLQHGSDHISDEQQQQQQQSTHHQTPKLVRTSTWLAKQRLLVDSAKRLPSERNVKLREKTVEAVKTKMSHKDLNSLREKKKQRKSDNEVTNCWKAFKVMMSGKPNRDFFVTNAEANRQLLLDDNMILFDSLEDLNRVKSTVIDISYALICYGIAAHRLDYYAQLIGLNYGLVCDTWANPTGLFITFHDAHVKEIDASGEMKPKLIPKTNHFVKVRGSALNLTKLHMLEQLSDKILKGNLTIAQARQGIKDIISAAPVYDHFMLLILARFLSSMMMSIMFDANPAEVLAACIAGLVSGILAIVARNYDNYSQVNVICTGIVSGAIAIGFKLMLSQISPVSAFIVSIAGVAPLLPGFGIAVSVLELSAGQTVSGICRLISAFLTALQVAFGVLVPHKFGSLIPLYIQLQDRAHQPNPLWVKGLLLPVNIVALIISFRAPVVPISLIFTVVACYCSFFLTYILNYYTHSRAAATFLSSVVVGLISNFFGWISHKHSGIIVCSVGITFLLPGSLSFRSIHAFLLDDTSEAVKFISDVATVSIALTIGLLVSNILMPSRKKLRW